MTHCLANVFSAIFINYGQVTSEKQIFNKYIIILKEFSFLTM